MKANYAAALKRVLAHEGGYANNPKDPGGETMKGVTRRVYDAYRDGKGLSRRSVKKISQAELQDIYRSQFWDAIKGDDLPAGIDYAVFDAAVNSGPVQAVKWLQRAMDGVNADGHVGKVTLERTASADATALINGICDNRMAMLRTLRTWSTFGPGWTRRVKEVRAASLAMADGVKKLPAPTKMAAADTGKALATDTKITETPAGNTATKQSTMAAGGLTAWFLDKFTGFSDWISSLVGMSPETGKWIVGGLGGVFVILLFAEGGMTLYDIARRRSKGESVEAS